MQINKTQIKQKKEQEQESKYEQSESKSKKMNKDKTINKSQKKKEHYDFTTIKSGPTVGLGRTGFDPNALGSIQSLLPCTRYAFQRSSESQASKQEEEKICIRKVVILKDYHI